MVSQPLPVSVPASESVLRGGAAARGCQARRHDVEDNIMSGCQAPLVTARFSIAIPKAIPIATIALGLLNEGRGSSGLGDVSSNGKAHVFFRI